MKRIFSLSVICCILVFAASAQSIITGTFNVRYDNAGDSANPWKDRAPVAAGLIRFHEFDIVGTQEGLRNQLDDLQQNLPGYAWYGIARDDGERKGEHSAIFYKKEKFSVLDSGNFWLSQTPDKPGYGWDARNNRICSWLKLRENKSKHTFYVFNVHYDHRGVEARKESSKLILAKILSIAGTQPVILTGDFNGGHESEWYNTINNSNLLKDALSQVEHPYINNGSFNSFQQNNPSNEIIDHIFVSKQWKAVRYGIITDTYHGKYPSDHYPVLVEMVLGK